MDKVQTESIVTKGFLVKYDLMLSSFPRWFTVLSLGFCGLIRDTQWIIKLPYCPMASKFVESQSVRYMIHNALYFSRFAIVMFALDWTAFAEYTKQLSQMELEKDEKSVKQINRERRIKNWVFLITLISYTMIANGCFFILELKVGIYYIFPLIIDIVYIGSHLFLIHSIVDLCICLKAAFQSINHHLEHFEITSPNSMLSELRRNRIMYSCAIRASQEAEKFARHYIAVFYFQFIMFNIVNIVDLLGQKDETSKAFVLFMALDTITTGYLTLNLVAVNKVSTEGMEDLYEISYDLKSYNLQNENNLFLNRMLWHNVGFTVSNLFLINPNFITALLSFVLTIALTMANYLYK